MLKRMTTFAAAIGVTAAAAGAQSAKSPVSFTGDLGYVTATGNTRLSTFNMGDKIVYTQQMWALTQTASYVEGQTKGMETANQLLFAARADYTFAPQLSAFGAASFERNPYAGFTRRTNEQLGVRWQAVEAPRDSLSFDAGGVLTQQTDVSDSTENYPAARLAISYKHAFSKAAYFQQQAEYIPNLTTGGAYRVNSMSAIVAPVSAHIGIKVSYAVQYNSHPPDTFGTTDRLLTTGVQVTF